MVRSDLIPEDLDSWRVNDVTEWLNLLQEDDSLTDEEWAAAQRAANVAICGYDPDPNGEDVIAVRLIDSVDFFPEA